MRDRRSNLTAGALALLLIVGLGAMLAWIGRGAGWFAGRPYVIAARFDQAPGIRQGTPVSVAGVPIGRVRHVAFADESSMSGGVVAELALDARRHVRRGAVARALPAGAASSRMVIELDPGPPGEPPLEPGATIRGESSGAAGSLLPPGLAWAIERSAERIGSAADALAPLVGDVQRLVEPRSPAAVDAGFGAGGNLASAVARLDAAARGLSDVLGDESARVRLREGIENLHAASRDSRRVIDDAAQFFAAARGAAARSDELIAETRSAVARAAQRIEETAAKLNRDLDLIGGILAHLEPVAAKVGRGEGTLGKMAADDRLYETLLLSLRRAGER